TYNVQGTIPNTAEAGGLLQLDSANGDLAANADGAPRLSVRVRLLSDISPNLALGLKNDDTLVLSSLFTLATPGPDFSQYSVRFNDASAGNAHQVLQLQVRFDASAGAPAIQYQLQDFDAGTITTLGTVPFAPPPGADRIRLTLSRPSIANNDFFASFSYLSSGLVIGGSSFPTAGQMFEGENFVRAELNVSQAVPEPGMLALLFIGLTGLWALRVREVS
ncbi:MAG TPA: PEP-CTERM sorting domain-containing protein, partial [Pyrinomonadaceae bacterium]